MDTAEVPSYIDMANGLNVLAVVARQYTMIFKLDAQNGGKLLLL